MPGSIQRALLFATFAALLALAGSHGPEIVAAVASTDVVQAAVLR